MFVLFFFCCVCLREDVFVFMSIWIWDYLSNYFSLHAGRPLVRPHLFTFSFPPYARITSWSPHSLFPLSYPTRLRLYHYRSISYLPCLSGSLTCWAVWMIGFYLKEVSHVHNVRRIREHGGIHVSSCLLSPSFSFLLM